jgi:HNH/ENDO VII superfamily nuclease with conserved GHE residues
MGSNREMRERPRDHGRDTRSQKGRGSASTQPQYNESLKRPSWDPNVRKQIFEDARDPNDEDLYICAMTGESYPKDDMQIDHKQNWEDWCRQKADIDDSQSMFEAYNDPRNLRLVHGGVNASKGKRKQPGKNYLSSMQS